MTDIRDDLFANCALWAYVEVAIQTGQSPPDSELTRRRAYQLFEEAKQAEPRNTCPDSPIAVPPASSQLLSA